MNFRYHRAAVFDVTGRKTSTNSPLFSVSLIRLQGKKVISTGIRKSGKWNGNGNGNGNGKLKWKLLHGSVKS